MHINPRSPQKPTKKELAARSSHEHKIRVQSVIKVVDKLNPL